MMTPVPLGMVLCDTIIIDKRTDKKSLIGTFSNIYSKKFPFRANRFSIYLILTDGHGAYEGKLICTDKISNELFKAEGKIAFPGGAKTVVEMVYDIGGLAFSGPGNYTFSFYCDDELVISRDVSVTSVKNGPTEDKDE